MSPSKILVLIQHTPNALRFPPRPSLAVVEGDQACKLGCTSAKFVYRPCSGAIELKGSLSYNPGTYNMDGRSRGVIARFWIADYRRRVKLCLLSVFGQEPHGYGSTHYSNFLCRVVPASFWIKTHANNQHVVHVHTDRGQNTDAMPQMPNGAAVVRLASTGQFSMFGYCTDWMSSAQIFFLQRTSLW